MKLLKRIIKWVLELPYSDCPKCGTKAVRFIYEDNFTKGCPNVYECIECKEKFI